MAKPKKYWKKRRKVDKDIFDMHRSYKLYIRKSGRFAKDYPLRNIYGRILRQVNERIFKELIIEKAAVFSLPYSLGDFFVMKQKREIKFRPDGTLNKRTLMVDFGKTKKLWEQDYGKLTDAEYGKIKDKPIVYLNRNFTYKLWWSKRNARLKNKKLYRLDFKPAYTAHLRSFILKDEKRAERIFHQY